MRSFNMSIREAKQRATLNGCYLHSNVDGTFRLGRHDWTYDQRKEREVVCDCLETLVIKSSRLV